MYVMRAGSLGLRAGPWRVVLAALGITLGITAVTAAAGISASSRAELDALLDHFGTSLITVTRTQAPGQLPGRAFGGAQPAHLPRESISMIGQIGQVESVSGTGTVSGAHAYRTDEARRVGYPEDGSIAVLAVRTGLLTTVGARVADGRWLDSVTARFPTVVLGAAAANRLGLSQVAGDTQVWLGQTWFTVIGILEPIPLAPELDDAALVGWPVAEDRLSFDGFPTVVYARAADDAVDEVWGLLARTADPQHPDEVQVSRPSDALEAAYKAGGAPGGTYLLAWVGAVALLAGGVGIAGTMSISVLERRSEVGIRRAFGATRGQVWAQFLTEAVMLSLLGGAVGVVFGAVGTMGYAVSQGWPAVVPVGAAICWVMVAILIGAVAGLYPAARAARLTPAEALTTR